MRSMNVERAETLDEVFEASDFVSLHVPRTPQTTGMVSADALEKMKPTAYLINVARGGIVDETALYNALKEGTIAGAALDVFRRGADDGLAPLHAPERRRDAAPRGKHRRGPGQGRHHRGRAGRDRAAGARCRCTP